MLSRRVPLCFYCVGKYNELSTHSSLTILRYFKRENRYWINRPRISTRKNPRLDTTVASLI